MRLSEWIKVSMVMTAIVAGPALMGGCEEKKPTAEGAGATLDKAAGDAAKAAGDAAKKAEDAVKK